MRQGQYGQGFLEIVAHAFEEILKYALCLASELGPFAQFGKRPLKRHAPMRQPAVQIPLNAVTRIRSVAALMLSGVMGWAITFVAFIIGRAMNPTQ